MREQITAGKSRLRQQIKELESKVVKLKSHPLLIEAQRLQKENARLVKRVEEVETAASNLVLSAIALVKIVTASFEPES